MGIKTRRAEPRDLDWIILQLREFAVFFNSKLKTFGDETYVRSATLNLIENHVVFVAEHSEKGLVGFIAGMVAPHLFNPEIRSLHELFWWVADEHRGSRAGLMLLNAYTNWGKENCDWVWMTIETASPISDRALLSRGFHHKEQNYLMEVS